MQEIGYRALKEALSQILSEKLQCNKDNRFLSTIRGACELIALR